ncbi:MAG: ATP-binding protein [Sphingomonadales bacterium]
MITNGRIGGFPINGIRGRLTLWFIVAIGGAVVLASMVVYRSGLSSIQRTLGQTYCQIASQITETFEGALEREITNLGRIAADAQTTAVALEERDLYGDRPRQWVETRLRRLEREWGDAGGQNERASQLRPQLSERLRVLARLQLEQVVRLSVYDRHGVLLAASDPPSHRVAGSAQWYRAVSGRNRRFNNFNLDRSFNYLSLDRSNQELTIVVPVWAKGEIAGFAHGQFKFQSFVSEIEDERFGETGEAVLVDYAGAPLHGKPRNFLIHAMATRPAQPATHGRGGPVDDEPYWLAIDDGLSSFFWRRLACVAPAATISGYRAAFDRPSWSVVVTQAPDESYAGLAHSLRGLAGVGGILIILVGAVGAVIARHIAAPLQQLQDGVRRFAAGERDHRISVTSRDEIGELATEFNRMAAKVATTEEELRAFAQAVEDAADAIIMTDRDGRAYYANPAFEAMTGYPLDRIRGRTASFLRSHKTPDTVFRDMWSAVKEGRSWQGELWNRRRNGEDYPVDLTVSPVFDENGEMVSLLGVHRDISLARKYRDELEREVEARTREISDTQGLTAMGRMASMIAHDLRNALSMVKMNLQILLRRHESASDADNEHCVIGLEQVRYMEAILHDMLSFARPEKLRQDWHDADEIISSALLSVTPIVEKNRIEVVRDRSQSLPKIYCDRIKILEALQNLLQNAAQSMVEGGMLKLSAHVVIETPVPSIRLTIEDTGDGIPPDVLSEIFEPFFTTRSKGTGLGLAIVKRIIEQHRGTVHVNSIERKGTTVAVVLPTEPESC